jgi:mutator protein MutT
MIFPYTVNLVYAFNDRGEVLLQKKARGFGKGNWNGPGGKMKEGETIEEGARREIFEETEIVVDEMEKRGEIEFVFHDQNSNMLTHVFVVKKWHGGVRNTGEGELKWFKIDELPLKEMWGDDPYWLPQVLSGGSVHMRFYFDSDNKMIKFENI